VRWDALLEHFKDDWLLRPKFLIDINVILSCSTEVVSLLPHSASLTMFKSLNPPINFSNQSQHNLMRKLFNNLQVLLICPNLNSNKSTSRGIFEAEENQREIELNTALLEPCTIGGGCLQVKI
jgi:hypothetical protein